MKWIDLHKKAKDSRTLPMLQTGKDQPRPSKKRRCCAPGKCCHQRPSDRTIRDIRDCLRSFLNWAITAELISRNVASLITLRTARTRKHKRWSSDEARRFLESAKNDGDPLYAAYLPILVMGLREGEVLGLPVDATDRDAARTRHLLATSTCRRTVPASPHQVSGIRQHLAP